MTEKKRLSHVGADGSARMVDVSAKVVSAREAIASGHISLNEETRKLVSENRIAKGNVFATARIAGIQAAKKTPELIPLCHTLPLSDIQVDLTLDDTLPGVRCEATARTIAQTGVEMEAMAAVAISLVTVYDMAKSMDHEMELGDISLLQKSGGKIGNWSRG